MRIRFFASIRDITREKEIEWAAPPTLGDLLRQLSERYGPGFRRWVLEGDSLGDAAIILVNGQDARHQDGVHTTLAAEDIIAILPMMAGGAAKRSAFSGQLSARRSSILARPLPAR